MALRSLIVLTLLIISRIVSAEWVTLRGNAGRNGYVPGRIAPPFKLLWVRHFSNERISTCVEPIIAEGKLFITTHNGNLYAIDAETGNPLWRFKANGPFLHSPAYSDGLVIAGNTDGYLYALEARSGKLLWRVYGGKGGFSASPTVAEKKVFIGSREGKFLAVDLFSGRILWEKNISVPIRQTASYLEGKIVLACEDLRVRCFEAKSGRLIWVSNALMGQTTRDYYPIIVKSKDREFIIIRTNPVLNMASLLSQDRGLICRNAGIDDSNWRNIDAWTKSERAKGNPQLWEKESRAITDYLKEHPEARSFFVLDLKTGKEVQIAPILWTGGCQGVGNLPVMSPDGNLLLIYRTAYGNWSLGVAPLVSLGLYDIFKNSVTPMFHIHGNQPPWNTFWGTADESQNLLLVGETLLLIHQGTLSGFNLKTHELFPIWGERDSWGGFRNLPWARNEWHGPSRSGVAAVGKRIYWQVGSRILCIEMSEAESSPEDREIKDGEVPTFIAPRIDGPITSELKKTLEYMVNEVISTEWMPLYVEPGLAGKEFFFRQSGDIFESLSLAFPHLSQQTKKKVKDFLEKEWNEHPPYSQACEYNLKEGKAREWAFIPMNLRETKEGIFHPFGNIYAVYLYAERCGEWEGVRRDWEKIKGCLEDFQKSGWRLDWEKGDLYANLYFASLIAFQKLAKRMGDADAFSKAVRLGEEMKEQFIKWWKRSGENIRLPIFQNIQEWDTFIVSGDVIFHTLRPHKAKVALFHYLTPEVADIIKKEVGKAFTKVWDSFELLCPTWHLIGEERQVHFGENFLDYPDFAYDAFKAYAWLKAASYGELVRKIDIPFCRADLFYIGKLAILLDKAEVNQSR